MSYQESVRSLQNQINQLHNKLRLIERDQNTSGGRDAVFGRGRPFLWGTLEEELPAGGSADVTIKRQVQTSGGGYEWETLWTMEDALAPPLMPDGTCIPATTGDDSHATWVCLGWFAADEEYYVIGAETCPTTSCTGGSSSS